MRAALIALIGSALIVGVAAYGAISIRHRTDLTGAEQTTLLLSLAALTISLVALKHGATRDLLRMDRNGELDGALGRIEALLSRIATAVESGQGRTAVPTLDKTAKEAPDQALASGDAAPGEEGLPPRADAYSTPKRPGTAPHNHAERLRREARKPV